MKIDVIKEIAKQHNIKTGKLKKAELIRAIQESEKNDACFETGKMDVCGQENCIWREDCN
ncbi:MAG TPA: SAP domain-containing protein [Deltaproteobacteria bacterium]|nr:SAP domain-containing protein [Deltaproteobacteria bacterium]HQB37892.1 SAP domain-containing protein [Deltaproteobacteria bacterium]